MSKLKHPEHCICAECEDSLKGAFRRWRVEEETDTPDGNLIGVEETQELLLDIFSTN